MITLGQYWFFYDYTLMSNHTKTQSKLSTNQHVCLIYSMNILENILLTFWGCLCDISVSSLVHYNGRRQLFKLFGVLSSLKWVPNVDFLSSVIL